MTKDMTVGNPTKLILTFSVPLLIGNIFQQFYNMVDAIVVGQFIGVEALAAVGATGSLMFLVLGFVMGITSGFGIPIAQSFGANDEKRLKHYIVMSFYLSLATTLVVTVAATLLTRPLLMLLRTPYDIIDGAYTYLIIIYGGIGAMIFYNMLACILRAVGDSRTPLYFLVLASILNIILDLLFIAGFSMNVEGAALATVIAQAVSAILCFVYIRKKHSFLKMEKEDLIFSFTSTKYLFKIAIPMALQFSITAVGTMILQTAINGLGSITVAAYTAASKVEQLVVQPFISLGVTMATYTGQNLGAGQTERIKQGLNRCIWITIAFAMMGSITVFFFGESIVRLFINDGNELVISQAKQYLFTAIVFFIPLGMIFIYRNVLQGMGETFVPMLAGLAELVARAFVAFAFVGVFGYSAICFASPMAWVAAAALLMIFYYKKTKHTVYANPIEMQQ
jgi:putative MATE family efflux protein